MASVIVECPALRWTQINIASSKGIIELMQGYVILTQQAAAPTQDLNLVALNGRLSVVGQERTYDTSQEAGEFIFAYAIEETKLSVTAQGGDR